MTDETNSTDVSVGGNTFENCTFNDEPLAVVVKKPEQLLKVEFTTAHLVELAQSEDILPLALNEVLAIVDRAPEEDRAVVAQSKKIIVAIFTED